MALRLVVFSLDHRQRALIGRLVTAIAFTAGLVFLFRLVKAIGLETLASQLAAFSPLKWIILFSLPLVTIGLAALRFWLILAIVGYPIPYGLVSLFSTASMAVAELLPGGAATELASRALLLGRSGLPTKTAILSVAIDGFLRFMVNSLLLFVVAFYLLATGLGQAGAYPTLVSGSIVAAAVLLILVVTLSKGTVEWFIKARTKLAPSSQTRSPWQSAQKAFVESFRQIKPRLFAAALVTTAGFFWEPLQLAIVLKFLNLSFPFWQIFWFYHALLFPRLIPVPAGLGVVEEGGILFAKLIGQSASLGLLVSLILRIRTLPFILLGLLILPFAALIKIQKRDLKQS